VHLATSDLEVWIADSFSRNNAELPSMPGALDYPLAQFTFSERTTRVRTRVIDCIKLPFNVKHSNPNSLNLDASSSAGGNLMGEGDSHKPVSHKYLFCHQLQ
jgi:hypothetical protein